LKQQFVGATRKEGGRAINNDGFVVRGTFGLVMDGAGQAQGIAGKACGVIRSRLFGTASLTDALKMAQSYVLNSGQESTFLGAMVEPDGSLQFASCGDSMLYVMSNGVLTRLNTVSKPRLGALSPCITWGTHALLRSDVTILASDGLTFDRYRLQETIKRNMSNPQLLPEAILSAARDQSDDVTVITFVF
jgi:hypothetical protein